MAVALKFSITTSHSATSFSSKSRPRGSLRLIEIPFLFLLSLLRNPFRFQGSSPASLLGKRPVVVDSTAGPRAYPDSTFRTSAPRSANDRVASGPAQTCVRSRTRTPFNGPFTMADVALGRSLAVPTLAARSPTVGSVVMTGWDSSGRLGHGFPGAYTLPPSVVTG